MTTPYLLPGVDVAAFAVALVARLRRGGVVVSADGPATFVQVMRHMPLLPEDGGDVDGGIDRQVRLPPLYPRGGIVGAHHGRQKEGHPVERGFQWLTISRIENREGTFWGFHGSTYARVRPHALEPCNGRTPKLGRR